MSDIETAFDESGKTASVVSEVRSEVIAVDDESLSVKRGDTVGSPVPSESARTAADSSALDSLSSSVHTSPSLQHQQPTADAQGLFCFCVDSDNAL